MDAKLKQILQIAAKRASTAEVMVVDVLQELVDPRSVNFEELGKYLLRAWVGGDLPLQMVEAMPMWMLSLDDKHATKHGWKLLTKMAERGSEACMYNLAVEKLRGGLTAYDPAGANALCKRVLASGRLEHLPGLRGNAMAVLADSLRDGRGCARSTKEAVKLYEQAAEEEGTPAAAYNAGLYYAGVKGAGVVELDLKRAADMYAIAADQGHMKAQTNLGILHYGEAFDGADPEHGLEMMKRSAAEGDEVARRAMENLAAVKAKVAKDLALAKESRESIRAAWINSQEGE